jgi:hypothetical protein
MTTNFDSENDRRKPSKNKRSYVVFDLPGWDSLEEMARLHADTEASKSETARANERTAQAALKDAIGIAFDGEQLNDTFKPEL